MNRNNQSKKVRKILHKNYKTNKVMKKLNKILKKSNNKINKKEKKI
jgi:hypothetical protein